MSPTQTVIDAAGFMLQLPALGLVDPAGEWVTLRAACGTLEQCAELLAASNTTSPPLRATETEFGVVRAQFQGAIWSIPTTHAQRPTQSEVFRVKIKRQPPSAVPEEIERTRLQIDTEAIFLDRATLQLQAATLPVSQARKAKDGFSVQVTGISPHASCSLETLQLYRLCLDPTQAQADRIEVPADAQAAAQWRQEKEVLLVNAIDLWHDVGNYCVNLSWLTGLRDLQAGMDQATREWLEAQADGAAVTLSGIRISPEEDDDYRGIDYALSSRDAAVRETEWRPVPSQAMDPGWVRCGVNLRRWHAGKRLFTKEDWPPRPTTLMRRFGRI